MVKRGERLLRETAEEKRSKERDEMQAEEVSMERAIKERIRAWKGEEKSMMRVKEEKAERRVAEHVEQGLRKEPEMEQKVEEQAKRLKEHNNVEAAILRQRTITAEQEEGHVRKLGEKMAADAEEAAAKVKLEEQEAKKAQSESEEARTGMPYGLTEPEASPRPLQTMLSALQTMQGSQTQNITNDCKTQIGLQEKKLEQRVQNVVAGA